MKENMFGSIALARRAFSSSFRFRHAAQRCPQMQQRLVSSTTVSTPTPTPAAAPSAEYISKLESRLSHLEVSMRAHDRDRTATSYVVVGLVLCTQAFFGLSVMKTLEIQEDLTKKLDSIKDRADGQGQGQRAEQPISGFYGQQSDGVTP